MTRPSESIERIEPLIGIVVPVFRHSGLIAEALASIENQSDAPQFAVAIVNDGCPYAETDLVCRSFQHFGTPKAFHYIRRTNGGLSAARNTGIRFLLSTYSEIKALYFLDADNRLRPYALAKMAEALEEFEDADWFYPDIEMFGLNIVSQYDGNYSGLVHASTNISEAGSLVRRRVFDAGVEFDEGMRQGFEDWDFWLGARERGFRGRHVKNFGFAYRKRPESMLADSTRDEDEIKAYMRRKRRSTFQIQNLLTLESREAARYAIMLDGYHMYPTMDFTNLVNSISLEEYVRQFWCWFLRADTYFMPPFILCASKAAYQAAADAGALGWIIWDLEARLKLNNCSLAVLKHSDAASASIEKAKKTDLEFSTDAHFFMIPLDLVREICADQGGFDWWCSVMSGVAKIPVSSRTVTLRNPILEQSSKNVVVPDAFRIISHLHSSEFSQSKSTTWKWSYTGVPARHTAYKTVRAAADNGVVFPKTPDGRVHIGLLLSFVDFSGVEKVAFSVARVFRQHGYVPHLVLFRTGDIHIPAAARKVFETIMWVPVEGLLRWDGEPYYGTNLSWWSQQGERHDVIGMLGWMDAVLNCQCSDAHGVMGDLRRRGVLTMTHQHVVELSEAGRPGGNAMTAKAFEHSYAAILTGSRKLLTWFVANGVPQEKLFNVDNAASYFLSTSILETIALEREERHRSKEPLRVLFGARMDKQKGLDRVMELVEQTRSADFHWRVVGKPIVTADTLIDRLAALVPIEEPVYSEEDLTDLYRWADVIVLPSRFEGVPLTAIEAMRCGAVMLVADAGGIREIIEDGKDGLIVGQDTCVEDMLAVLRRLHSDREELLQLSRRATRSGQARSWAASLQNVLEFLVTRLNKRPADAPVLEPAV